MATYQQQPMQQQPQQPQYSYASGPSGLGGALDTAASMTTKKHPKVYLIIVVALVLLLFIFVILYIVYLNKWQSCNSKSGFMGINPLGNLNTGGNNPMWQGGMGDAGWGGSMHSLYNTGESRVYGASAEGGHTLTAAPVPVRSCGVGVSGTAANEAQVLTSLQAYDPSGASGTGMSDDVLTSIMNGGGS